jgi:hypothetical protein|nr:MAG TPA_asm: hypothetical protein [Caudoviricetes sp.]
MKVNTISLNSVRLNTIALNHIGEIRSGGGGSKPSPIPQWIREHISFYYDMSKPMDVYPDDFGKWTKSTDSTSTVTSTNITITNLKAEKVSSVYIGKGGNFKGMKIRVSGLVDGQELYWGYWNNSLLRIPSNGDYTLSPIEQAVDNLGIRSGNIVGDCNITIEMLPSGKSVPTNEILKVSGYLQDLSGRKRNMKLNNFLFAEMSGVGGYNTNFSKWAIISSMGTVDRISSEQIIIRNVVNPGGGLVNMSLTNGRVFLKCNITGITEELKGKIVFRYASKEGYFKNKILDNGYFEFDSDIESKGEGWAGFTSTEPIDNCNITITQIPKYPGALVTDGVDDYGLVENLSSGVKMLFMTVNPIGDFNIGKMYYSQRHNPIDITPFYIFTGDTNIAYAGNRDGVTYINGVLNKSITYNELFGVKHTITTVNDNVKPETSKAPSFFWEEGNTKNYCSRLAFYNSIAFDSIPTEADGFTEQELIDYVITNIIGQ